MTKKELNQFQIRNIEILKHLLIHDFVDDDVVENLRRNELEYFSVIEKLYLLEQQSNIDLKTNLLKFRYDYLTTILKTASRIYHGMTDAVYDIIFIRFDIDDFSVFNNQYGHDVGDRVLIDFSNILKECSRPTDYVIRFGGEEFDVILPGTNLTNAKIYLDRIYKNIHKYVVNYQDEKLKVTISAGVTCLEYKFGKNLRIIENKINDIFQLLQKEADNALYEAKYLGKDQYCVYDEKKKDEYSKIRKKYVMKN